MEQYFLSFLLKSIVITAIILGVSMLNVLFGKAFPAKLRYAIWLAILAGLMLPLPPAIGRGIIRHDPFTGYSSERPKPVPKYVPVDELEKLMNTPMKSSALEVILTRYHIT